MTPHYALEFFFRRCLSNMGAMIDFPWNVECRKSAMCVFMPSQMPENKSAYFCVLRAPAYIRVYRRHSRVLWACIACMFCLGIPFYLQKHQAQPILSVLDVGLLDDALRAVAVWWRRRSPRRAALSCCCCSSSRSGSPSWSRKIMALRSLAESP